MFDFEYQLKMLPDKPGVYLMKNSFDEVIYVGKAKILKNRVRQYFQQSKNHSEKVKAMVTNISEFEYIITDSEMEALILECNLIKKYRPKYNILLKDDKGYPYIKITINEDFPRVFISRTIAKDGSRYFGPYTDYSAVRETIELIKKIFPIRSCKRYIKEGDRPTRPCLNYHIKLCSAPCGAHISKQKYALIIEDIIQLLSGKDKNIIDKLESEMKEASNSLQFEKAASLRDKIFAVKKITEKQKIIMGNFQNDDYINIAKDEEDSCVQIFFVREGKIMGREHFILEHTSDEKEDKIICEFIKNFYSGTAFVPKTIYVPHIEDKSLLEQWLAIRRGSKVEIKVPKRGEKKELLNLVKKNAKLILEQFKIKYLQDKALHEVALEELANVLEFDDIPNRIEAYDISNIQGVDSVGSMVVFENGRSKNSDYRRFKIKTVEGANDYDSMREILRRRFKRGIEEIQQIQQKNLKFSSGKFSAFPDLILIDGGKGHVNVALEVLKELNIEIPVAGMVKDDSHTTRGIIYNNTEKIISLDSNVMKLITRIQDEVHRFAISYHRTLRNKRVLKSILDDIPNIGTVRKKELLKKFGSIENIKKASVEQLLETPSMDKKSALSIKEFFTPNQLQ
ncbi:excinuclease ABC subunit UvrC [Clostridium cochlearium]|uniref:excinuclease ABC subunit UvrC n=1 Tax=Clostridium cochlearium TaxID=1494 RepID=UPI001EDF52B3|nr:excinuclease ABC subunit UvrC [Clostridium cochlearium]MBV1818341.1 excinuclease ABC subunit UvrC [Bacteroidales bacterium MSK.15.36]MCG4570961.1 excinuclease ABC subunit UvrC [Clostridium cochlearium]MCG4579641.1 excinuclease ABC subunit UvrC [Clostridium cochlearium]